MAEAPRPRLSFDGICPCGEREAPPLEPLPAIGDDFDWTVRDFDGFRRFMLEELAARFPERRRWNPADLEVVLLEVLAAVLDQLSDGLDRVASEAYLETARRPESVRRLLGMIGYDAPRFAVARGEISEDGEASLARRLEEHWLTHPHAMELARREGPRSVHQQRRMVSVSDYALRLEEHPLILRAKARAAWTGAWATVRVAVIAWDNQALDEERSKGYPLEIVALVQRFHRNRSLVLPDLDAATPTIRTILRPYLEAYRMVGQEVLLEEARPVPITIWLSVRVAPNYFQSEVRREIGQVLGRGAGGFFRPGRLRFGEDLYAGDLIETVMALDGVENVCLNRFKRLGSQFPDESASGTLALDDLEIAICDGDPQVPERGGSRLVLHGGLLG